MARNSPRVVRPRKNYLWHGVVSNSPITVAAAGTSVTPIIDTSVAGDVLVGGATIVRVIGNVEAQVVSNNLDGFFRAGIITLNEDAIGDLATPDPWVDPANWMWEKSGWIRAINLNDGTHNVRFDIDVKVSRKMLQAARELAFIFVNLTASGTALKIMLAIKALVSR